MIASVSQNLIWPGCQSRKFGLKIGSESEKLGENRQLFFYNVTAIAYTYLGTYFHYN